MVHHIHNSLFFRFSNLLLPRFLYFHNHSGKVLFLMLCDYPDPLTEPPVFQIFLLPSALLPAGYSRSFFSCRWTKDTFHLTVTSTVTMTVPHRHTLSHILFIAAKPKHCQLSKLLPGKISSRPCHLCTIPSVSLHICLKQHFKNWRPNTLAPGRSLSVILMLHFWFTAILRSVFRFAQ